MAEQTVEIEKMAFGGAGVGRVEGKVCFVPFTAPGDRVRIRVKSEKRSYLQGEVVEIVHSSPLRVVPPCPVFGECGGCDWQHLDYQAQLAAKEEIFAETLWRIARVERELILPIVPSPMGYAYRARVQFKVRCVDGEARIGFFRAGSHYVIGVPGRCAISDDAVNDCYTRLTRLMAGFPEPDRVPQVDVAVGDDGGALLIFHYIGGDIPGITAFLRENAPVLGGGRGIFLQCGRKRTISRVSGREDTSYAIAETEFPGFSGMRLHTGPGGFSQVNYGQNRSLVDIVLHWADPCAGDRVLDLYCGNGNFSLPLARYSREVVGMEGYEPSIRDALANRERNGVTNASFHPVDVVEGMKGLAAAGERFRTVVLDPPRTGAPEAVGIIPALEPERIIYISCDPPTLARDLAHLRKSGYGVTRCIPVDMFPQTYHMESVTLLERATA